MTWRDRPLAGWDLETTGPDPDTARVVSACVGIASREHGWQPRTWLLRQPEPIPDAATAVHGITTDQANRDGTDPRSALAEITAALDAAWQAGFPVVGANVVYDFTVLDRDRRRYGMGGLEIRGPVIDVLVLDKAVDRYRRGSRRLTDVAAHYGIEAGEAHAADGDALTAARLAWWLAAAEIPDHGSAPHPGLATFRPGELDLEELHVFLADAYAFQRASFAEYRRRKGQPLDDESTDWPIRYLTRLDT